MYERKCGQNKEKRIDTSKELSRKGIFGNVYKSIKLPQDSRVKNHRNSHRAPFILPMKSQFLWLCLMSFIQKTAGEDLPNPFFFTVNGTHYKFWGNSLQGFHSTDRQGIAWDFFQNVSQTILEGNYGNAKQSDVVPANLNSIWRNSVCEYIMEFARDAAGKIEAGFENNVAVEVLDTQSAHFEEKCAEYGSQLGKEIGISLAGMLLIIAMVCLIVYFCTRRNGYQSISSPRMQPSTEIESKTDNRGDASETYQNNVPLENLKASFR